MKKYFVLFAILLSSVFLFFKPVNAEINSNILPKMTLSEALNSGVKEAIITDFDIPEFSEINDSLISDRISLPSGPTGRWIYQYTADPFSFYRNSLTGEWRMLQTTSTVNHTVNTVIGGWAGSPYIYYNPAYAHLLGG